MSQELPEWAAVGKKVFARSRNDISVVTIARATPTSIVDDRGNRYPIRTLSRSVSDWDFVRLASIDDPVAIRARHEQLMGVHARNVFATTATFNRAPSEATAVAIEAAVAAWRSAASEVTALSD